jgi:hypothetical protein
MGLVLRRCLADIHSTRLAGSSRIASGASCKTFDGRSGASIVMDVIAKFDIEILRYAQDDKRSAAGICKRDSGLSAIEFCE